MREVRLLRALDLAIQLRLVEPEAHQDVLVRRVMRQLVRHPDALVESRQPRHIEPRSPLCERIAVRLRRALRQQRQLEDAGEVLFGEPLRQRSDDVAHVQPLLQRLELAHIDHVAGLRLDAIDERLELRVRRRRQIERTCGGCNHAIPMYARRSVLDQP